MLHAFAMLNSRIERMTIKVPPSTWRGEIQALRWADYDPKAETINISHSWSAISLLSGTKTGGSRKVEIPRFLCDALLAWKQSSKVTKSTDYIFQSRAADNRPLASSTICKYLYVALADSGISAASREKRIINLHAFRHGLNTMLTTIGVPDIAIRKHLGHSSRDAHEGYFDASKKAQLIREALDELFPADSIKSFSEVNQAHLDNLFQKAS
jgi:integrase